VSLRFSDEDKNDFTMGIGCGVSSKIYK